MVCEEIPAGGCDDPSGHPLLASLTLTCTTAGPNAGSATFAGEAGASALVCIDNGDPSGLHATSGWVHLNGDAVARPNDFKSMV